MNWQEIPFVRLVVPFSAGIFLYDRFGGQPVIKWTPLVLALLLVVLLATARRSLSFRRRLLFGAALGAALLLLGLTAARQSDWRRRPDHIGRWDGQWCRVAGLVREAGGSNAARRVLLEVRAIDAEKSGWRSGRGRLLVYLPDAAPLVRGDTLVLAARILPVRPPRNPGAFDYAHYLSVRGVYHTVYPGEDDYLRRPPEAPDWRRRISLLRASCLARLRRRLSDDGAYAVSAALALGYRADLSDDLREAYAGSGAMHVLAVSGLHVGLVFIGLGLLLQGPVLRVRWLPPLLQLAGVWGFVLLADLPPSAVRAAAMCTFFLAGRIFMRQTSAFNILAASAFSMLMLQPRLLFDVGFQLSYSAVAGILIWQPVLYRAWLPANRLVDYLWRLLALSFAAQLGTFPLSLYYFHQFPLFFWLSGLVAVPAASLMLGGSLGLLAADALPGLGAAWGRILEAFIRLVNSVIEAIAHLPASQLKDLWIDAWGAAGCYFLIAAAAYAVWWRQGRAIRLTLLLALALTLYRGAGIWQAARQQRLAVYYVHGHTLIDWFDGRRAYSFADHELPRQKAERAALGHRRARRISSDSLIILDEQGSGSSWRYRRGLLQAGSRRLLVLDAGSRPADLPPLQVDMLLIRGDPPWSPHDLPHGLRAKLLVCDASNSPRTVTRWKEWRRLRNMAFHDVRSQGALVLDR